MVIVIGIGYGIAASLSRDKRGPQSATIILTSQSCLRAQATRRVLAIAKVHLSRPLGCAGWLSGWTPRSRCCTLPLRRHRVETPQTHARPARTLQAAAAAALSADGVCVRQAGPSWQLAPGWQPPRPLNTDCHSLYIYAAMRAPRRSRPAAEGPSRGAEARLPTARVPCRAQYTHALPEATQH